MTEITKSEAKVLTELIEMNLFDIIRKDEEIDNIEWLAAIMSIYECGFGRSYDGYRVRIRVWVDISLAF